MDELKLHFVDWYISTLNDSETLDNDSGSYLEPVKIGSINHLLVVSELSIQSTLLAGEIWVQI